MSIELARYSCPECGAVWDVWLEDGEDDPTGTLCPDHLWLGEEILGERDLEAEDLWVSDEWGGPQ